MKPLTNKQKIVFGDDFLPPAARRGVIMAFSAKPSQREDDAKASDFHNALSAVIPDLIRDPDEMRSACQWIPDQVRDDARLDRFKLIV